MPPFPPEPNAKPIRPRTIAAALFAALTLSACFGGGGAPPPSYARYNAYLPCANRIGRCFELRIGGAEVRVIEDEARQKALAADIGKVSYEIKDVYWELAEPVPVARAFEVELAAIGDGEDVLGGEREPAQISVWSLAAGPRSESAAIAQEQAVLKTTAGATPATASLAAGRYVFEVRYIGTRDWDRKFVLLTIR
ncbi:MAG: hypothetical protein KDH15_07720 [Rhodocyclaceae bacterium]|nr:hypothetical protein [Rhodocyclaceae bacterium]